MLVAQLFDLHIITYNSIGMAFEKIINGREQKFCTESPNRPDEQYAFLFVITVTMVGLANISMKSSHTRKTELLL